VPPGTGPLCTQVSLFGQVPPHCPVASSIPHGVGVVGAHSQPLSSGFTRQVSAAETIPSAKDAIAIGVIAWLSGSCRGPG
jgi:hypothetical protein